MKKRKAIILCMLIVLFATIIAFTTVSRGYTYIDSTTGLTWYYEVKNGEAVNVYVYSGTPSTIVTIPSTLGGYSVTSIKGKTSSTNIFGSASNRTVTEVIIPETVKDISDRTFYNCYNLEKVNIPTSLQNIGTYAFYNSYIKNIVIPDNVSTIGQYAFNGCSNLTSVYIGNSITTIARYAFQNCSNITEMQISNSVTTIEQGAFYNCSSIKEIALPDSVTTIGMLAFYNCSSLTIPSGVTTLNKSSVANVKNVYINNTKDNINISSDYYWNVNQNTYKFPHIHYRDCKHYVTSSLLEGVKLTNVENGKEITQEELNCREEVTFRLEQEEGYNYDNLLVNIKTNGDYDGDNPVLQKIDLNIGETYTIRDISSDTVIFVQDKLTEGFDLSLRQYIYKINDNEIANSRESKPTLVDGKLKYQHTKNRVYVKTGDKIIYKIRVYNEGTIEGTANSIVERLPEGLEFVKSSNVNIQYEWNISEDGRVATTEYMRETNLVSYQGGDLLDYIDISIECVVTAEKTDDIQRLVNIAEIQSESMEDIDSVAGNITELVDSNYMIQESEVSTENSYIVGTEDDNDFENAYISNKIPVKYAFRINKIDGISDELLNGATFDLLDENKELIQTGVTADGGILDFGMMETKGEGTDIYYIKETATPEGYKNAVKYLIKVEVLKELITETEIKTSISCDITDIDVDTSRYKMIPIYTKEQFVKIGNNEDVLISEENTTYKFDNSKVYTLMADIDLQGENWTPLNTTNIMLDGNGHKILNLKIDANNQTTKKFGLFGTYSGIIENLTLENVDIDVIKYVDENAADTEGKEETEADIDAVGAIVGYLENGILKNCKVAGDITTSVDNVGGLVGHSKKGTIAVFRGCINEADVTVDGSNAGGLIGCALGPVNVILSTNKGAISATTYNAGGLIGCAESEGYKAQYIEAGYDSSLKSVELAVKNEKISGEYNIKLQKVDSTEELNLLNGATFSIYDRNKQIISGYENVVLENGSLQIPKDINTIGTDIYYIKEIKAPIGYKKITDEFIKLEIDKIWNVEKEEYKILANTQILSQEEFETDEPKAENTSTTASGEKYAIDDLSDIVWKLNKVSIVDNSSNEGTISTENLNAGGLVRKSKM